MFLLTNFGLETVNNYRILALNFKAFLFPLQWV